NCPELKRGREEVAHGGFLDSCKAGRSRQLQRDAAFKILNPMTVPQFFRLSSNNAIIQFLLEVTRVLPTKCQPAWETHSGAVANPEVPSAFPLQGTPEIREHYIDSKKDVDRHLKLACEQFIQQQTQQLVEPLQEFLSKNNVQQVFQKLHAVLKEEFSNEDLQIIACPSMEQVI
ncbi:hypothetical protein E2320_004948, partial [Naja naja]